MPTRGSSSAPVTLQSAGPQADRGMGFIIVSFSRKKKWSHSTKRQRGSPGFRLQQWEGWGGGTLLSASPSACINLSPTLGGWDGAGLIIISTDIH